MADKKLPKAVKRQRVLKRKNKKDKSHAELIDLIMNNDQRNRIAIFKNENERPLGKKDAFGTITCPFCGKASVLVANPEGQSGKPEHDYIMRHNAQKFLCSGSLVPIKNLFKSKEV